MIFSVLFLVDKDDKPSMSCGIRYTRSTSACFVKSSSSCLMPSEISWCPSYWSDYEPNTIEHEEWLKMWCFTIYMIGPWKNYLAPVLFGKCQVQTNRKLSWHVSFVLDQDVVAFVLPELGGFLEEQTSVAEFHWKKKTGLPFQRNHQHKMREMTTMCSQGRIHDARWWYGDGLQHHPLLSRCRMRDYKHTLA